MMPQTSPPVHSAAAALSSAVRHVHLAARIGEPVDRPWTGVQVILPPGMALPDVEGAIRAVAAAEIGRMREFRSELIRGEHAVC